MNVLDILYSWWKSVKHTAEENKLAKQRMDICKSCPFRSKLNVCTECGCPLLAKKYSFFPCEKWEA
jgi:hypothetical protein